MITTINEFKKYLNENSQDRYTYNWSGYEATIRKSSIFGWQWSVCSIHNDYTNFRSDMDTGFADAKEAEIDMFNEIETRIGSTPDKVLNESIDIINIDEKFNTEIIKNNSLIDRYIKRSLDIKSYDFNYKEVIGSKLYIDCKTHNNMIYMYNKLINYCNNPVNFVIQNAHDVNNNYMYIVIRSIEEYYNVMRILNTHFSKFINKILIKESIGDISLSEIDNEKFNQQFINILNDTFIKEPISTADWAGIHAWNISGDTSDGYFIVKDETASNWEISFDLIHRYDDEDANTQSNIIDSLQTSNKADVNIFLNKAKKYSFIGENNNVNPITNVSGGNYVDKIETFNDKQLEIIKDFDDSNFEYSIVYDKNTKDILFSGKYNKRTLDIFYDTPEILERNDFDAVSNIGKITKDIKIDVLLKHSYHSMERQGRASEYIKNSEIKATVEKATEKLIDLLINNTLNVGDPVWIYNTENDLNVVGSLNANKHNSDITFKLITVMFQKDFKNKHNTFKVTI